MLWVTYPNKFEQGEDVVAGIRTPEDLDTMKNCMPEAFKELVENCEILERHYKDMMVKGSFLMWKLVLSLIHGFFLS